MITLLIGFAVAFIAATLGFNQARSFVRTRLRFVDAVQSPFAPIIAGAGAFLIGGVAVGMGVASGARDAKNGYYLAD